jgi:hypothetical protein
MEINEVKKGDKVTFLHKGKKVIGTVIHHHDGSKTPALAGHVNVQPDGSKTEKFPMTIHVAKLKPAVQEETNMENIKETVLDLIDHIDSGDAVGAEKVFNSLLQTRIDELLDAAKVEVASAMFNPKSCDECEEEQVDEALKGNQHKIDANKNGKVDAQDFKMLRAKKKGMKEEAEQVVEYQKGLFRPPSGFTKKGIEKGGGVKTTYHYAKKSSKPVGATMKMGGVEVPLGQAPKKKGK